MEPRSRSAANAKLGAITVQRRLTWFCPSWDARSSLFRDQPPVRSTPVGVVRSAASPQRGAVNGARPPGGGTGETEPSGGRSPVANSTNVTGPCPDNPLNPDLALTAHSRRSAPLTARSDQEKHAHPHDTKILIPRGYIAVPRTAGSGALLPVRAPADEGPESTQCGPFALMLASPRSGAPMGSAFCIDAVSSMHDSRQPAAAG